MLTGMFDGPSGPEPVSGSGMGKIVSASMEVKKSAGDR
ncbi:hypothetical protein GMO_27840 [Gluconobacter morbifer G707]|uniref:Uncharacterized protein n=1 Tax=Gluconobacter morbifer G707 TaxID=1088869 RepID=G6XMR6_9PROT|nr:hypothetical protein GMO_27840 [Gluconobacter morbifer G707]